MPASQVGGRGGLGGSIMLLEVTGLVLLQRQWLGSVLGEETVKKQDKVENRPT